ncbi:MAG: tetratricopeptide repeat protein [Actinomycetota bacterium]|nr:tetratricopeptide repeat protein [Actinomycetota bacterium]
MATSAAAVGKQGATDRLDRVLTVAVWTVGAATLAFSLYFAYSVYAVRQAEREASPAARAVAMVSAVVDQSPNDAGVRVRLAETLFSAGLRRQALEQLKIALELDPENVPAYLDFGIIHLAEGNLAESERYFLRVIELTEAYQYKDINDKREKAFFYLGAVASADERYEDAVGYYKAALRIRRDASDTYLGLGKAFLGLGDSDQALEQLRIAVRFDPGYAEAQYEIGLIYLDREDLVNAAWHLRAAVDAAEDSELAHETLESVGKYEDFFADAQEAYDAGDFAAARDAAAISRALAPKSAEAVMLHAMALEKLGKKEDALTAYRDALDIEPDNAEAKEGVTRLTAKKKK